MTGVGLVEVVLADADPSGLAKMLAGLIESNLARQPGRAALLRPPAVVELDATDADVMVTVRMRAGRIEIANGPANHDAQLEIHAGSHDLLDLAAAPLRLGVPDPILPEGRRVLRRIGGGSVRVAGMLRHPLVLSRFARLLSVR